MSVKIKVSYTTDEELHKVIRLLSPEISSYKMANRQDGQYKRAYIVLRNAKVKNVNAEKAKKNQDLIL